MNPKHTFFHLDCRPMKAACHAIIDNVERGVVQGVVHSDIAHVQLVELANSVQLDGPRFALYMSSLMAARNFDRARKLVNAIEDRSPKARAALVVIVGGIMLVCLVFFGIIALIVWWIAG